MGNNNAERGAKSLLTRFPKLGGRRTDAGGETVYEGAATLPEQDGTVLEAGKTAPEGDACPTERTEAYPVGACLLDSYRVEQDPILGGMGAVWRVRHTGWDVDLAMKRPKGELFRTEDQKRTFIDECDAWIGLGLHPNIVSCYYVRELDGIPTIFSEWMDRGSLRGAMEDGSLYGGSEEEQRARLLDIAIQFARGLRYAHENGLIHQDVKPDNLLLTGEWDAKVADFGIARARAALTVAEGFPTLGEADGTVLVRSGGYTPAYCSMEQMDGKVISRRTDLYSWAVSVMEMYAGQREWSNGVVAGLGAEGYLEHTRVPVPAALRALLLRCLAAEPEDRPHDFGVVTEELLTIYRGETGREYSRAEPKAAPDTADSLNNRALSYLDLGQPEKAEKLWEQAVRQDGSRFLFRYNYQIFLWQSRRCSDVSLKHSFEEGEDGSGLWAASMVRLFLLRGEPERAEAALKKLDPGDGQYVPLAERIAREKAKSPPTEETLYIGGTKLSRDNSLRLEDLYEWNNLEGKGGYRILEPETGRSAEFENPHTLYDKRYWADGRFHFCRPRNGESCFIGEESQIVVTCRFGLWYFDRKTGALLRSHPPVLDEEGRPLYIFGVRYSDDGFVLMDRFEAEPERMPLADIRLPYVLSRAASFRERAEAEAESENNYRRAEEEYQRGDYTAAWQALERNRQSGTLLHHEPSVRLWTALGKHLERDEFFAVVPTEEPASPTPPRAPVQLHSNSPGQYNRADNGRTEVTLRFSHYAEYDSACDCYEHYFDYSLDAVDVLSGNPCFTVSDLGGGNQTGGSALETDVTAAFLSEHVLDCRGAHLSVRMDFSDREQQIRHDLRFPLGHGLYAKNSEEGVSICGFSFPDSYDEMDSLWGRDIIPCRKQNYRLLYTYRLP